MLLPTLLLHAAAEKIAQDFQSQKSLNRAIEGRMTSLQMATAMRDIPGVITEAVSPGGRYVSVRQGLSVKNPGILKGYRPMTEDELLSHAEKSKGNGYVLRSIHDELRSRGHEGIAHKVPAGFRGKLLDSQGSMLAPTLMSAGLSYLGHGALKLTGRSSEGPTKGLEPLVERLKGMGIKTKLNHSGDDYFSPGENLISVGRSSHPAVFAHEAGHALGSRAGGLRQLLSRADNPSRRLAPAITAATLAAAPWAMDTSLDESPENRRKRLGRYRTALTAAALSHLPTLMEEGAASLHGAKLVADAHGRRAGLGAAARLAPAFATYAAGAALPALTAYHVHQKMNPEKYKDRRFLFFKRKTKKTSVGKPEPEEKVAMMSEADQRKARQQYYMQHRGELLSAAAAYRSRNAGALRRKAKKYRKEVASGVRKQRERYTSGNSYTFGGFR